jgi:hypothetical protein
MTGCKLLIPKVGPALEKVITVSKGGLEHNQIGQCSDVLPKISSNKGQITKKATTAILHVNTLNFKLACIQKPQ